MILFIDHAAALRLVEMTRTDDRVYYRTRSPVRAIVRIDCGALVTVRGRYVDALIGWDAGTKGFVLPAFEGLRHTKITIRRTVKPPNGEVKTLSEVFAAAPTSTPRNGGES